MDDQKLKAHFQFDDEDLEANHRREFSEKQMRRLQSRQSGTLQRRRTTSLILLAVGLCLLGIAGLALLTRNVVLPAVIVLASFGVGFLLVAIYLYRASSSRQDYLLRKVEGPIAIVKEQDIYEGHPYERYELYVGGQSFTVDPRLAELMKQGDVYAVYFAEGSVTQRTEILAVESPPPPDWPVSAD
ncbi:MAG: hypothetical protein AB1649_07190 [Chloroflexota bacterium]